jgi:hypothetical protein
MQIETTTFPAPEPNQNILHKAYFVEQICLLLAIQIVLINLLSHVFSLVGKLLPASFLHMRSSSALAVLCATVAMFLTETGRPSICIASAEFLPALRHSSRLQGSGRPHSKLSRSSINS